MTLHEGNEEIIRRMFADKGKVIVKEDGSMWLQPFDGSPEWRLTKPGSVPPTVEHGPE